MSGYPIDRASYRTLDPDWEGEVVIADIDRTYLATRFSSMKGMLRIPFERAAQKRDIEGMARLLRELRRGPGRITRDTPLFFLSASPKQLRPVIERKMGLDGISFDGTTFKDWGRVFGSGRPKRIKEQIGFKLTALLTSRSHMPEGAHELLLGDDLETDPITYGLYADVLAGRIPTGDLARVLRRNGVGASDAEHIERLRRELKPGRGVRRAFIRLERHQDTDDFLQFGPGVVGCRGAFQMAVVHWRMGLVSLAAVGRVAAALAARKVSPESLGRRVHDLRRRAMLDADEVPEVLQTVREHGVDLGEQAMPDPDPRWVDVWGRSLDRVWTPEAYVGS
jgi:hypothetical protein